MRVGSTTTPFGIERFSMTAQITQIDLDHLVAMLASGELVPVDEISFLEANSVAFLCSDQDELEWMLEALRRLHATHPAKIHTFSNNAEGIRVTPSVIATEAHVEGLLADVAGAFDLKHGFRNAVFGPHLPCGLANAASIDLHEQIQLAKAGAEELGTMFPGINTVVLLFVNDGFSKRVYLAR